MKSPKINKVFKCADCRKEWKSESAFKNHKCVKVFTCECGFKTIHEPMFLKHICKEPGPECIEIEVHKCAYCSATFKKESTLLTHMCVKKKRFLNKNTKETLVAFEMWMKFREFAKLTFAKDSTLSPLDAFVLSREFDAFYSFAVYSLETNFPRALDYIKTALIDGVSIDLWSTSVERKKWILSYIKNENITSSVERSIGYVNTWAIETGNDWKTFFCNVSVEKATHLITNGEISPWFIYASMSYESLLNRMSDSEFMYIYDYINPEIWAIKKLKFKEEFTRIKELCEEFGI